MEYLKKEIESNIDFKILIDDSFLNIESNSEYEGFKNKNILSLVNDFEDGKWRYRKFQEFIWNNIAETALSYQERIALIDKSHSTLIEAAKKLRLTDLNKSQDGQGSELAEIILYGFMKHHYKALPVVPKIFYKQNAQDNAKGADSVHIVLNEDKTYTIWFGEAKFYNSIDDERLYSIVNSVENSLLSDKLRKENSIVTNVSDLNHLLKEEDVLKEIKKLLASKTSIDELKPLLHIPILILHECKITFENNSLTDEYCNKIIEYHKDRANSYFKKQIKKCSKSVFKYSEIHFHLILFPVPEKKPIVDKFINNVNHFKNQD